MLNRKLWLKAGVWFLCTVFTGCAELGEEADGSVLPEVDTESPQDRHHIIHEMHQVIEQDPFRRYVYNCSLCSFEQFNAIEVPATWLKSSSKVILPVATLRTKPSLLDIPATVDFVEDVEGEEFELIAQTVAGELIEFMESGPAAIVQVARDTLFTYTAGQRLHVVTDLEGNEYVLFGYQVSKESVESLDFQNENIMADLSLPTNWTYRSHILDEELNLDSDGLAFVLSLPFPVNSIWQRR